MPQIHVSEPHPLLPRPALSTTLTIAGPQESDRLAAQRRCSAALTLRGHSLPEAPPVRARCEVNDEDLADELVDQIGVMMFANLERSWPE